jgi:uncharacterized protein (DUF488 family)
MKIFTIGFTKKSAEEFFHLLIKNKVQTVIDIRLNNVSQLAGFTKQKDLEFFLDKIANIKYIHYIDFAPSENLLQNYQKKIISWQNYESEYLENITKKVNWKNFDSKILENACLLCSESKPNFCHRRILAEFLSNKYKNFEIMHL